MSIAQNLHAASIETSGQAVLSLPSLVLRLLASDRLAVAALLALFLLAAHMDEVDHRLMYPGQSAGVTLAGKAAKG